MESLFKSNFGISACTCIGIFVISARYRLRKFQVVVGTA